MTRDYKALRSYIVSRLAMPFAWGTNDCVVFAAGAVKAEGGPDVLATLPKWTSEEEAKEALAARGGIEAAVNAVLKPLAATSFAMRGDVALVATAAGCPVLMVVDGDRLVGPDLGGLGFRPRLLMKKAWAAL